MPYVEQLRKIVSQTCTRCRTEFCFACGEKFSPGANGSNLLWHCGNLQGVILGVGLYMVERLFEQQKENSETKDTTEREAKRRRTRDADANDGSSFRLGGSKKSKGGIGYAGELKEDVG